MTAAAGWSRFRARGPEQLAPTLGLFLVGFFLLPSSKSLNNVYYAAVLAPALFLLRGSDWRWLAGSPLWRAAMLLLVYLTLSGLWSADFTVAAWLREAKGLPYVAVYVAVLACVCARRPAAFAWLLRAVAVSAVVGTVVSAALFYAKWPLTWRISYHGPLYQAVEAGTVLGSCLLLVLLHLLPASRAHWQQACWLAAAAVLFAGLVLTGSRTPLGAALLCLAVGLGLRRQWRWLAIVGTATVLAGTLIAQTEAVRLALARGDSYRFTIWQHYLQRVADKPWLGEGVLADETTRLPPTPPDTEPMVIQHPHSAYLATALYGGVPALLMLLTAALLALRQGRQLAARGEPVWLVLLLFALLCMVTDGNRLLNAPRAIWFFFWLPIGVLIGRQVAHRAGAALPSGPGDDHSALGRQAADRTE